MKKHPWYHYIFPVLFLLMIAFIIVEAATPGSKSSSQSRIFASLFDHGAKTTEIIAPQSIQIEGADTLYIDKENEYQVTFQPSETSDRRVRYEILSGKECASLDENRLTGTKEGKVTLKATSLYDEKLTDTFEVSVKKSPITRLTLSTSKSTVLLGETFRFDVKEANINDIHLVYDEEYFISPQAGYLKAIKKGNTSLKVTLKADENITSSNISMRIEEGNLISPTRLDYDEEKTIYVNEKLEVTPQFNQGCNDSLFTIRVDGKSEKENTISFEEEGEHVLLIQSVANESLKKECRLHVISCKAKGIKLNSSVIQYGKMTKLDYELISEKDGIEVTDHSMEFFSADEKIAKVTTDGYIIGYQKGNVEIRLTWMEDERVTLSTSISVISMDVTKYNSIHTLVRKLIGHYGCFLVTAVFGILTCFLFFFDSKKKKYFSTAGYLLIGLLIAILSEVLQIFTSDRGPSAQDVMIDFAGYLTGYVLSYIIYLIIRKKKSQKENQG